MKLWLGKVVEVMVSETWRKGRVAGIHVGSGGRLLYTVRLVNSKTHVRYRTIGEIREVA